MQDPPAGQAGIGSPVEAGQGPDRAWIGGVLEREDLAVAEECGRQASERAVDRGTDGVFRAGTLSDPGS
jgi:hypothetical protein